MHVLDLYIMLKLRVIQVDTTNYKNVFQNILNLHGHDNGKEPLKENYHMYNSKLCCFFFLN